MYWPGMSKDIEDEVSKCSVCLKYQKSQHREPMLPHDIPHGRWQKIAMDIMTYHGRAYLVVVDYYSKYPEVSLLPDKTAISIITVYTKRMCARYGIPEEIVSDNMPVGSRELKNFAYEWGIKTAASSPTYAQSNGQAEICAQTLKGIFKKADEDGREPYLALLEYRNTPVSGLQYTPSQMLTTSTQKNDSRVATRCRGVHGGHPTESARDRLPPRQRNICGATGTAKTVCAAQPHAT